MYFKVRNDLKKTRPVIAGMAAWEKISSQGAGEVWYNILEDIVKLVGADQEKVPFMEKFASTRQRKRKIEEGERQALRPMVKETKHIDTYAGGERIMLE